LDSVCSTRLARMISRILRSPVRSPDSRKFFITCWVIVEAPRSVWPRVTTASRSAEIIASGSKPGMFVEIPVLGRDEGMLHLVRDIVDRHEQPAFLRELVDQLPLAREDAADRRRRVIGQLLMAGQIGGIHPDHAAHGQRAGGDPQHKKAEDPSKKGQDETQHGDRAPSPACSIRACRAWVKRDRASKGGPRITKRSAATVGLDLLRATGAQAASSGIARSSHVPSAPRPGFRCWPR
jgi:hypothetical protein